MATLPILADIVLAGAVPVQTVDMHTTGEPTRIVYSWFPTLQGETLLEKMADAKTTRDGIRSRLMHEPRGYSKMFGAILANETRADYHG